jgi:hypothetical protein
LTVEKAKEVAANAAGGIKNMAEKQGLTAENAKGAATNVAGHLKEMNNRATAAVTRQAQDNWRTFMPLFCASLLIAIMMAFDLATPSTFAHGNLAHLIPLAMLMGEPILSKALAVTTANPRQDSPQFGCGWLSWSFSAILSALADSTDLLAKPENACKVVNLKSGHPRANTSFVLSRLLRDLEAQHARGPGGLTIEVLEAGAPVTPLSGLEMARANIISTVAGLCQLGLAGYAFGRNGDLNPLFFFSAGLFLMLGITEMPVWNATKFSARKAGPKNATYALMRGNGHKHVFVIRNAHPEAWNLEDMAGGVDSYDYVATPELATIGLTALGFLLLTLTATGMSDASASPILFILGIGTFANILNAALPREAGEYGVALKSVETIANDRKVMAAIQELETKYPGSGAALAKEFFPAVLSAEEQKWWDERKNQAAEVKDLKEEIVEKFDVAKGVEYMETNELEVEMEKAIRGQ